MNKLCKPSIYLSIIFALVVIVINPSFADTVFGPQTCLRDKSSPSTYNFSFSVSKPKRCYICKIYNSGENNNNQKTNISTITLNGKEILRPHDFNQQLNYLEIPVNLSAKNTLNVEMRGKPGEAITIKIDPYVVIDLPKNVHIFAEQPIAISGHFNASVDKVEANGMADAISGKSFVIE